MRALRRSVREGRGVPPVGLPHGDVAERLGAKGQIDAIV